MENTKTNYTKKNYIYIYERDPGAIIDTNVSEEWNELQVITDTKLCLNAINTQGKVPCPV